MHEWQSDSGHARPFTLPAARHRLSGRYSDHDHEDELGWVLQPELHRILRVGFSIPPCGFESASTDGRLLSNPRTPLPLIHGQRRKCRITVIFRETFMSPNIRHLTLLGLSIVSPLLFLIFSLFMLTLADMQPSGYFIPKRLVRL